MSEKTDRERFHKLVIEVKKKYTVKAIALNCLVPSARVESWLKGKDLPKRSFFCQSYTEFFDTCKGTKMLKQKRLKTVAKAWPDTQQPSVTRCWFLELECGHVVHRPIHNDPPMPPQRALCEECLEHSCPTNPKVSHGIETRSQAISAE
jgi:hypothetical protein